MQDPWQREETASAWQAYCDQSTLTAREMTGLVRFAPPLIGQKVLDVACGTGHGSRVLFEQSPARLVLLDRSAAMLSRARALLGNAASLEYLRACVPPAFGIQDGLADQRFDRVVLHQGIPSVVCDAAVASRFASWVHSRLALSGTLHLAVHDSALQGEQLSGTDVFRSTLFGMVQADPVVAAALRPQTRRIGLDQMIAAMRLGGLELISQREAVFDVEMHDRRLMWRAPAVLASLFDLDKVDFACASSWVEQAFDRIAHLRTPPRRAQYLTFGADVG